MPQADPADPLADCSGAGCSGAGCSGAGCSGAGCSGAGCSGADPAGADPADADVLLAGSADPLTRARAARRLVGRRDTPARLALLLLVHDTEDTSIGPTAAAGLLQFGDDEWDAVLTASWLSQDVGLTEGFRGAFVDRLLAGEDVRRRLEQRLTAARTSLARKGALEMLMALGYRPIEYIPDREGAPTPTGPGARNPGR